MAVSTSPPRSEPTASAEVAEIHEFRFAEAAARAPPATAEVSEDGAEEVGEALASALEPDFTVPERRAVGRPATARAGLGIALPVGPQRVVALALSASLRTS